MASVFLSFCGSCHVQPLVYNNTPVDQHRCGSERHCRAESEEDESSQLSVFPQWLEKDEELILKIQMEIEPLMQKLQV